MRFSLVLLLFPVLFSLSVYAQVDASSELLLQPAVNSTPKQSGFESGRYKVKKTTKNLPPKKVTGTEAQSGEVTNQSTAVIVSAKTPTTTTSTSTTATVPAPAVTSITMKNPKVEKNSALEKVLFENPVSQSTPAPVDKSAEIVESKTEVEAPSVTDQVRELMMGNGSPEVEAYKEQIHEDDIRMNRIEVNVLPGVILNSSKSNYSFRDYDTFSPKLLLGANFWMTPFLGIYGNYTTSMGADVASGSNASGRSPLRHEWNEIGLDIRRFFGMSRRSNSITFGFHISEYKFLVPGDETNRVQLRSSGFGLHLMSRIPVAPSYAWTLGGKMIPRVQHSEIATGLTMSSGSIGESVRVDISLGGEFKMSRESQVIWDITTTVERNQFNGSATMTDPETNSKPKGVFVDNTFVIFSMGYRWGQ